MMDGGEIVEIRILCYLILKCKKPYCYYCWYFGELENAVLSGLSECQSAEMWMLDYIELLDYFI